MRTWVLFHTTCTVANPFQFLNLLHYTESYSQKIHDQLSSDKRGLARHIRHFAGNPLRILISLRMQLVSGCKEVDTMGNIWKGSGLALGSHQKYLHLPFLQLMLLSNLAIHQTSQIGEGHQRQRKWSLGTYKVGVFRGDLMNPDMGATGHLAINSNPGSI